MFESSAFIAIGTSVLSVFFGLNAAYALSRSASAARALPRSCCSRPRWSPRASTSSRSTRCF
jgi:ABC-type spermidine/putrescine transport system permease subunit II